MDEWMRRSSKTILSNELRPGLSYFKSILLICSEIESLLSFIQLHVYTNRQIFVQVVLESIYEGECNTILSVYTLYRHLKYCCIHPSICRQEIEGSLRGFYSLK